MMETQVNFQNSTVYDPIARQVVSVTQNDRNTGRGDLFRALGIAGSSFGIATEFHYRYTFMYNLKNC